MMIRDSGSLVWAAPYMFKSLHFIATLAKPNHRFVYVKWFVWYTGWPKKVSHYQIIKNRMKSY